MADSNNVNVSVFFFLIWFMLKLVLSLQQSLKKQWMEIQQEREVQQKNFTLWSNSKTKYSNIYQAHLNLPLRSSESSMYNDFITVFVFVDNFQKIASIFKCDTSSSLSLLDCLRKQEAEHIILNSKVGETSWQQNFLMAHLQNFSSASGQSSLMVRSKVDFSYLLLKYSLNVEAISHINSFWKFGSVTAAVKLWARSVF